MVMAENSNTHVGPLWAVSGDPTTSQRLRASGQSVLY